MIIGIDSMSNLIKTYRKKPVEIKAVLFDGSNSSVNALKELDNKKTRVIEFTEGLLYIKTLEGTMIANKGDYIIEGLQGELYPCKPDIFKQTYSSI